MIKLSGLESIQYIIFESIQYIILESIQYIILEYNDTALLTSWLISMMLNKKMLRFTASNKTETFYSIY